MADEPVYTPTLVGGRGGIKSASQPVPVSKKKRKHGTGAGGVVISSAILIWADGFLTEHHHSKERLISNFDIKVRTIHDMGCALAGDQDIGDEYSKFIEQKVQHHLDLYGARPSVHHCADMVKECHAYLLEYYSNSEKELEIVKTYDAEIVLGGYDYGKPQLWIANKAGARRAPKYCFAGSGGQYLEVSVRNGYKFSNTIEVTTESIEKGLLAASQHDSATGGEVRIATIKPLCVSVSRSKMGDLMLKHGVFFREISLYDEYSPKLDSERLAQYDSTTERKKRLSKLQSELRTKLLNKKKKHSGPEYLPTSFSIPPPGETMLLRFLKCVRFSEHVKISQRRKGPARKAQREPLA